MVFIAFNNDTLFMTGTQMVVNFAFLAGNLKLISSLAVPAMDVRRSIKNILVFLTLSRYRDSQEISSKAQALTIFTNIHEKFTLNGYFAIDFQFVFKIMITGFSYVLIILQFELESSRVESFNVFSLSV